MLSNWLIKKNVGKILLDKKDRILGVDPSQMFFGFTYHSYMIPPYKPDNVLILGYGNGTISNLIKKIHGYDIKIVGNDINFIEKNEDEIIIKDAREYLIYCINNLIKIRYDYVVVDLSNNDGICDFVFSEKFSKYINEITKTSFSINIFQEDIEKLKIMYNYFNFEKFDTIHNNYIIHWSIKNIEKETKN